MSEDRSRAGEAVPSFAGADKYRQEAADIRQAAAIIHDERFQEQLLSIADQYDAWAASIEIEQARQRAQMAASSPTLRRNEQPRRTGNTERERQAAD
jgi:hypothetical protein